MKHFSADSFYLFGAMNWNLIIRSRKKERKKKKSGGLMYDEPGPSFKSYYVTVVAPINIQKISLDASLP